MRRISFAWATDFLATFLMLTSRSVLSQPADSVEVTFRYQISGKSAVYLTGEFNSWKPTAWPMTNVGGDTWIRTVRLRIGGHPTGGVPGAYQYKFYYPNASPWPNDPLNHHVNPKDNDNSFLYVKDPTIYHFLPNHRTGLVKTRTPTISAYLFPKVGSVVDTSTLSLRIDGNTTTGIGRFYNFSTQQLIYIPPAPLSEGGHTVILNAGSHADTVTFTIQTETPKVMPLPAYARHGVTLPSPESNDSTTFRIRVGGTHSVVLRVAPAGQPVASAQPILMRKDPWSDNWWMNLKLAPGTYEYLYQTDRGTMFYDPWGRWNGDQGSRFTVGSEGLTADDYLWQSKDYIRPPRNRLIIYELHMGEFAGGYYGLGPGEAGFPELTTLLPYLDSLGVNAIELMPINDFGSVGASGHSWGYDVNSYFALEPSYGTPREFKALVDSAHARGIAVIVDVVFNHLNDTGPLWQMQPDVVANPYFKANTDLRYNEDALFFFRDLDHWTPETQELIYEALKMWIDEYRVDGFRYDFTQGIGWNVNEPTKGILGWANRIDQEYGGTVYQIAEHLPESPTLIRLSGLTGGWHDSYHDEVFDEARFKNTSLTEFEELVLDLGAYPGNDTPSITNRYADRSEPVNANVNHDEQSLIYEMNTFQNVALDEAIKRDKLYATFLFTSLGIPMLWEGMEFSEARGWRSDGEKLSYRPVQWSLLNTERGRSHYQYYRALIFQRRYNPALYRGELRKLYRYESQKVLVWGFEDPGSDAKVMAVANLSNQERTITNVPWLAAGTWHNVFDQTTLVAASTSIASMTIPAYTALVYSTLSDSALTAVKTKQKVSQGFLLSPNYPNPFNLSTTVRYTVPKAGHVTLKVFNPLGQEVRTLIDEVKITGEYAVQWDGRDDVGREVPSGVYLLTMRVGAFQETVKAVLMK